MLYLLYLKKEADIMKFLITMGKGEIRNSFFTDRTIAEIQKYGEIVYNDTDVLGMSKEVLMEKIRGVDVLFSGWGTARVDSDVLACADKLKIHAHTGGSVANYISKEEYDRGIVVLSGNNTYARSVAEGCLCYTLMGVRRADKYLNAVREGGWKPEQDFNQGLIGKKIGIVGYGAIARYYVELLKWFNADLYVYSKYISDEELTRVGGRKASLKEIFSECDVISLHSAMIEENRGMITAELLSTIKDRALFVNTARAGLIDNEALIKELKTGRFNAVIDVYTQEPLEADSLYRTLPNVMPFPHIAGPTFDMREKVVFDLLKDINLIEKGQQPENEIPYNYAIRMTV
jgi:phosphoglycerate dehydrogenase-like enzyme